MIIFYNLYEHVWMSIIRATYVFGTQLLNFYGMSVALLYEQIITLKINITAAI